jgi:hypothetical protein
MGKGAWSGVFKPLKCRHLPKPVETGGRASQRHASSSRPGGCDETSNPMNKVFHLETNFYRRHHHNAWVKPRSSSLLPPPDDGELRPGASSDRRRGDRRRFGEAEGEIGTDSVGRTARLGAEEVAPLAASSFRNAVNEVAPRRCRGILAANQHRAAPQDVPRR